MEIEIDWYERGVEDKEYQDGIETQESWDMDYEQDENEPSLHDQSEAE